MKENNEQDFNVEAALSRMEEINNLLAQQGTSLKDALALYKEGVALAEKCKASLEGVEKELKIVNPDFQ